MRLCTLYNKEVVVCSCDDALSTTPLWLSGRPLALRRSGPDGVIHPRAPTAYRYTGPYDPPI
eukprot:4149740-Prymnesium_polylepis.2